MTASPVTTRSIAAASVVGRSGEVPAASALPAAAGAVAAQFVDYDNDGLLDVLLVSAQGLRLLRNLGSSFFISVCVAEIVRSTSVNYGYLVENVSVFNKALTWSNVLGNWNLESANGLARLSREVTRQATMIAYLNAFGLFTAACAVTLPLILLMRGKR